VVIIDNEMPALDGNRLARWIHSRYSGIKIPQITGVVGAGQTREKMPENPAGAFLQKPLTTEALLAAVEHLLGGKRLPDLSGGGSSRL
jgi:CheY-like chemotaxis protein